MPLWLLSLLVSMLATFAIQTTTIYGSESLTDRCLIRTISALNKYKPTQNYTWKSFINMGIRDGMSSKPREEYSALV